MRTHIKLPLMIANGRAWHLLWLSHGFDIGHMMQIPPSVRALLDVMQSADHSVCNVTWLENTIAMLEGEVPEIKL